MTRWYCDTCTPARVIGDRACPECCGWQPDPTNEDD